MAYTLKQFNQEKVEPQDVSSNINLVYMTPITEGTVKKKKVNNDIGIENNESPTTFYNDCVTIDGTFDYHTSYYFHCKIKRMISEQVFYVYLLNYEDEQVGKKVRKQYLKTVVVSGGDPTEWVDFEVVFKPLVDENFNCILFDLQRTLEDYSVAKRNATIVYEELDIVNDITTTKLGRTTGDIVKMGIQSYPGLFMVINGEGIHIGRTGIYEIKNKAITVDFFSIASAASENKDGPNPIRIPTTGAAVTLEQYLNYIASLPPVEEQSETNSQCIFGNSKLRGINLFTIDYIYEDYIYSEEE